MSLGILSVLRASLISILRRQGSRIVWLILEFKSSWMPYVSFTRFKSDRCAQLWIEYCLQQNRMEWWLQTARICMIYSIECFSAFWGTSYLDSIFFSYFYSCSIHLKIGSWYCYWRNDLYLLGTVSIFFTTTMTGFDICAYFLSPSANHLSDDN